MKSAGVLLVTLLSLCSFAQDKKNELGLLLGAEFIPQRTTATGARVDFGNSVIFSANYARHLTGEKTVLFLEFPFAAAPQHTVRTSDPNFIRSLATLYVAPSLRVKFAGQSAFSPWLSAGFGYGLYEGSERLVNGAPNPARYVSTGTAQFGGGVDLRTPIHILFPISLRGELRDFYTVANPRFGTAIQNSGQHNLVASGGFVIHF